MANDDLDHIPSIVPTRDGGPEERRSASRGRRGEDKGRAPAGGGGAGIWARLFITVSLVVAAVACAWAWQLQQQLQQAEVSMADYAARIGDLEARLSDTDEGMTQNAAAQAVRLKELDSEVRKLWDNVWKKSKARLAALEASSGKHDKSIKSLQGSVSGLQGKVDSASGDLAKLKNVAGDLSRLMAGAKANQAEVERVADTLNRIDLDVAKLNKRVQGNDEWEASVDAFRRQVNASLAELQSSLRALQSTGP